MYLSFPEIRSIFLKLVVLEEGSGSGNDEETDDMSAVCDSFLMALNVSSLETMKKTLCLVGIVSHKQGINFKPHIRDKRLYGMLTSGLTCMLIPVTHPTQCVAECAKCGFSGQTNTTWGPSPEFSGPSPDSI